ncbi:MAG TPA: hypothetical protein VMX13_04865 [Sedimentisphaerales bacterium]|nr:hypothetical protein [Sedimentisphaerales bacterium]
MCKEVWDKHYRACWQHHDARPGWNFSKYADDSGHLVPLAALRK